jgi:hypothetical protein
MDALDARPSARMHALVDRAIAAGARSVDELCKRTFAPTLVTWYFDWPNDQYAASWRLWLDNKELVSVTSLTSGGVVIPAANYNLEPNRSGPPYNRIEIKLSTSAAFGGGATPQRDITVVGLGGYTNVEESVGTLAANLGALVTDTATVTWTTARVGVGDIFRIDSERMIVTARTWVDSTQNLGGPGLAASAADVSVPVTTGSAFAAEEVLLVGSEQMLVTDVAGNTLTVKRAWNGSTLAVHATGADLYTLTGVQLERGALGTTAAAHLQNAVIYRWVPPPLVRDLNQAEAENTVLQQTSGYARTVGSGEAERQASGAGLEDARKRCLYAHGRRARTRAV